MAVAATAKLREPKHVRTRGDVGQPTNYNLMNEVDKTVL